jgi:hypothetical protein
VELNTNSSLLPPVQVQNLTDWTCSICTFLNEAEATICGACGTPKPAAPSAQVMAPISITIIENIKKILTKDTIVLPFKNIILNMWSNNTIEKNVNIIAEEGDYMFNDDNTLNFTLFDTYLTNVKMKENFKKLLKVISYKTDGNIDNINEFDIDDNIIDGITQLYGLHGGGHKYIDPYYSKYLKYKQKYLHAKKNKYLITW